MRALTVLGVGLAFVGIGVSLGGLLSTASVGSGIVICVIAFIVWRKDVMHPDPPERPKRVGYIGREGSKGNLRRARFGQDLDVSVDNAGEVDAEEARFSE